MSLQDVFSKKEVLFVKRVFKGVAATYKTDLGLLLSNKVIVADPSFDYMPHDVFISSLPGSFVRVTIAIDGACTGQLHIFFNVTDAKILCGIMMMVPTGTIQQEIHKEFNEEDLEVFKEIANQINGSLGSALREHFTFDFSVSLKTVEVVSKSLADDAAEALFPDDYLIVQPAIKINEFSDSSCMHCVPLAFMKEAAKLLKIDEEASKKAENKKPEIKQQSPPTVTVSADADPATAATTVLLGDSDGATRDMIKNILASHQITFFEVSDGIEVLPILIRGNVDVAILDQELPSINGLELCKKIKQNPRTMNIPVIILSTCSTRENVLSAVGAGAKDFIVKPIERTEQVEKKIMTFIK